jgi:hypothetical protein
MILVLSSPAEVRKAAAFVEALNGVEGNFDFRLNVGDFEAAKSEHFEPVTFGPGETYVVLRNPEGDLVLALDDKSDR